MINRIITKLLIKEKHMYTVNELNENIIRDIMILTHRVDKALINEKKNEKYAIFVKKLKVKIKDLKRLDPNNSLIEWANKVINHFECNIPFTENESNRNYEDINPDFTSIACQRFSCRKWNKIQDQKKLKYHAKKAINCAIQSPTSSNRQPWRFILFNHESLGIFTGLKESHAVNAPFGILILMDTRVYLYDKRADYSTQQMYLDAGAAIMSMIYYLEINNFKTCWNHLGRDLINSREKNKKIYKAIVSKFKINQYMEPTALLVFGKGDETLNTKPPRQEVNYYILENGCE